MSPRKPTTTAKVSLTTVAEHAGVSKMTASRVLRGVDGFSEDTRQRVMAACDELGYVPNKVAQAFASGSANTLVGIGLPTVRRELLAHMLEGMEAKLTGAGYQPLVGVVGNDDELEHQWLTSILSWRPSGLIVLGRQRSKENKELLLRSQVPIVEVWDLVEQPIDTAVGFSQFDAGYAIGAYLASRYSGPLGYVGASLNGQHLGERRMAGYQEAVMEARGNRRHRPKTLFLNDRDSFYSGYYGTEQLLSRHPNLRGLYYLDDNMAFGGLMFCRAKGIKVPGDVAIAGFGDMDITAVLPQSLTTTSVNRLRIGKTAVDLLFKRLSGKASVASVDVGFKLVEGETA